MPARARRWCARALYVALIDQSLSQLGAQARRGQQAGEVRDDVRGEELAILLMCIVIGAQTLLELDVPLEATRLAQSPPQAARPPRRQTPPLKSAPLAMSKLT